MDLWDLTKLLIRRWAIALPMIVLTVTAAALTTARAQPDYTATAYVQLVPPVADPQAPALSTPDKRNPWIALGLQTIGNAAIVTVADQSFMKELRAAGYSDAFTLVMSDRSPLVTIEVVANSGEQATRSAERIVEQYIQDVARLQTDYGVAAPDAINAHRLGRGINLATSNSKVKRALVAVAGAGLFLTVALTVAADAWLRRRARRRLDAGEPAAPDTPGSDVDRAARSGARVPAPRASVEDETADGTANETTNGTANEAANETGNETTNGTAGGTVTGAAADSEAHLVDTVVMPKVTDPGPPSKRQGPSKRRPKKPSSRAKPAGAGSSDHDDASATLP